LADGARAAGYYERAAEAGDADALYDLGHLYHHGAPGLGADGAKAEAYYRRAADAGVAGAAEKATKAKEAAERADRERRAKEDAARAKEAAEKAAKAKEAAERADRERRAREDAARAEEVADALRKLAADAGVAGAAEKAAKAKEDAARAKEAAERADRERRAGEAADAFRELAVLKKKQKEDYERAAKRARRRDVRRRGVSLALRLLCGGTFVFCVGGLLHIWSIGVTPSGKIVMTAFGNTVMTSFALFPTHVQGNTNGNLVNYGNAAQGGDRTYLLGSGSGSTIDSIRSVGTDGLGRQTVWTAADGGSLSAPFLNVVDGTIYFLMGTSQICSVGTDGSNEHVVWAAATGEMIPDGINVGEGAIYFIKEDSLGNYSVCSVGRDGSDEHTIWTATSGASLGDLNVVGNIVGDRIYFVDQTDSYYSICSVGADGSNERTLVTCGSGGTLSSLNVVDDTLYFIDTSGSGSSATSGIYSCNSVLESSSIQTLMTAPSGTPLSQLNVVGDKVYFTSWNVVNGDIATNPDYLADGACVCSIGTDGSNEQTLFSDQKGISSFVFNVAGGKIYCYVDDGEGSSIYTVVS